MNQGKSASAPQRHLVGAPAKQLATSAPAPQTSPCEAQANSCNAQYKYLVGRIARAVLARHPAAVISGGCVLRQLIEISPDEHEYLREHTFGDRDISQIKSDCLASRHAPRAVHHVGMLVAHGEAAILPLRHN